MIECAYTSKTGKNLNEVWQPIEHGFKYVTEMDGATLFRKRK